jgi:hypothetical protein
MTISSSEQRFYLLLDFFCQKDALDNTPNPSVPANDDGHRKCFVLCKKQLRFFRSKTNGIIHLCPANEPPHFRELLRRISHSDHLQASAAIIVLQLNQVGNFHATRRTPGGPKVYQNDLAPVVAQTKVPSLKILEFQLRRPRLLSNTDTRH